MYREKILFGLHDIHYQLQKSTCGLASISMEITRQCNLGCLHCYMNSQKEKRTEEISHEDIKHFIDSVANSFGTKISIAITGGEPFIREDIFEILEYIKNKGFNASIATNSTLLTPEKIKLLEEYVSSVSVSLDGFKDSHNFLRNADVYERTLHNIKLLTKSKIPLITVKTSVYKKNINDLDSFFDTVKGLHVHDWHIFPVEPTGRGKINKKYILSQGEYLKLCDFIDKRMKKNNSNTKIVFEEQSDLLKRYKACDLAKHKRCHAGINSFAVLYNGDIVKCIQDDREDIKVYGNIKKDDIKKVWKEGFSESRCKSYKYCDNHHFLKKNS